MANDNRSRYGGQADFAEDALFVDAETTLSDVREFLTRRIESPYRFETPPGSGNYTHVWNFASYEIEQDALDHSIHERLDWGTDFVIPFQVAGTWAVMFHLLPTELKEADILVYQPEKEVYYAYNNFYNALTPEQADSIRQDLARRTADARDPDPPAR